MPIAPLARLAQGTTGSAVGHIAEKFRVARTIGPVTLLLQLDPHKPTVRSGCRLVNARNPIPLDTLRCSWISGTAKRSGQDNVSEKRNLNDNVGR